MNIKRENKKKRKKYDFFLNRKMCVAHSELLQCIYLF